MTSSHPSACLPGARVWALTTTLLVLSAIAVALALPQQAGARARNAACTPTHARAGHGSRTCSAASKDRRHRKGKALRHRAKPTGRRRLATGADGAPGASADAEASCPNGVDATASGEGSFTCADGSEPGCVEGFAPVVSSDGSKLLCEPESSDGAGEAEEPESEASSEAS
jgi:hypothetical protein